VHGSGGGSEDGHDGDYDYCEEHDRSMFRIGEEQHRATIRSNGALIVSGVGPGSLRPDDGEWPQDPDCGGRLRQDLTRNTEAEREDRVNTTWGEPGERVHLGQGRT